MYPWEPEPCNDDPDWCAFLEIQAQINEIGRNPWPVLNEGKEALKNELNNTLRHLDQTLEQIKRDLLKQVQESEINYNSDEPYDGSWATPSGDYGGEWLNLNEEEDEAA